MRLVPSAPLICPGHSRPVAGIEFSADTDDGVFLISACHDKTAMIRSGETGDWIGTFEGHKGAVWGAALNAPATRAATTSGDFSAKVWDALTGDELLELKHRHIVRCCDWSADSTMLVTGGKEAKLRLFDLNQPESEPNILLGHESGKAIKVVRYLPDGSGKLFLSAGDDKTLRLWDVRTQAETKQLNFDGPVNSVEISRDEKTLTIAAGTEVSFWDTNTYAAPQPPRPPLSPGSRRGSLPFGAPQIYMHQALQLACHRGQRLWRKHRFPPPGSKSFRRRWRQLLGCVRIPRGTNSPQAHVPSSPRLPPLAPVCF
jgi:WD40 repeat protein